MNARTTAVAPSRGTRTFMPPYRLTQLNTHARLREINAEPEKQGCQFTPDWWNNHCFSAQGLKASHSPSLRSLLRDVLGRQFATSSTIYTMHASTTDDEMSSQLSEWSTVVHPLYRQGGPEKPREGGVVSTIGPCVHPNLQCTSTMRKAVREKRTSQYKETLRIGVDIWTRLGKPTAGTDFSWSTLETAGWTTVDHSGEVKA